MNFIFDFDGTLCDSIALAAETISEVFTNRGITPTNQDEAKKIGLKGILNARNISAEIADEIISEYRTLVEVRYSKIKPFPEIRDALMQLSQKNTLGVVTTNNQNLVTDVLTKHGLTMFKFIYSEKGVFNKSVGLKTVMNKYKLDPNETFYIGDETRDVEAAKNAGIRPISVTWGAESKELLEKSNPYRIINQPEELINLV